MALMLCMDPIKEPRPSSGKPESEAQDFWVSPNGSFVSGDFKISPSGLSSISPLKFYSKAAFESSIISKFTKRKKGHKKSPEPEQNSVLMASRRLTSAPMEEFSLSSSWKAPTTENATNVESSEASASSVESKSSPSISPALEDESCSVRENPAAQLTPAAQMSKLRELDSSDNLLALENKHFETAPGITRQGSGSGSPFVRPLRQTEMSGKPQLRRLSSLTTHSTSRVSSNYSSSSTSTSSTTTTTTTTSTPTPSSSSSSSSFSASASSSSPPPLPPLLPLSPSFSSFSSPAAVATSFSSSSRTLFSIVPASPSASTASSSLASFSSPSFSLFSSPSSSADSLSSSTLPLSVITFTPVATPSRRLEGRTIRSTPLPIPTSTELRSRVLYRNALKATRINEEKGREKRYLSPMPEGRGIRRHRLSVERSSRASSRSASPEPPRSLGSPSPSFNLEIDCGNPTPTPSPSPTTNIRTLASNLTPSAPTPRVTTTELAPSPWQAERFLGRLETVREPTEGEKLDPDQFTHAAEKIFDTSPSDLEMIPMSEEDMMELASIGRGQNGSVVKALHLPSFNLVALKSVNVLSVGRRGQLLQELIAYSKLQSSAVVSFVGAYFRAQDGVAVLASDYMNCGSLEKVVKAQGPINEKALRYLARKLVEGFGVLQKNKLLHRDMKPQNILCNHKGAVQLCDFGLTTQLDEGEKSSFLGTRCYLSPERLHGKPYGFPSDIWALGVTLLYCVYGGDLPFFKMELWDMIQAITDKPPQLVPSETISETLCDFVNGCLRIDTATRSTVGELAEHPFLQTEEDDLEEWKKVLDPDHSHLDTVLEIISEDLSLDASDIIKIRQSPVLRSYRRLRNTPYRNFPSNNPSPKNGGGTNDKVATIGVSDLKIISTTGGGASPQIIPSQPSPPSSNTPSSTSSPAEPSSRRSSLGSGHTPVLAAVSLGHTPILPPLTVGTLSDQFMLPPSVTTPSPQHRSTTPSPTGEGLRDSVTFEIGALTGGTLTGGILGSQRPDTGGKTPGEVRVKLLLWVVQHLADQFGLPSEEIVNQFEAVLRKRTSEEMSEELEC